MLAEYQNCGDLRDRRHQRREKMKKNSKLPARQPQVATSDLVRLLAPLRGQYCSFQAGELVKVNASSRHGCMTIERGKWRNSLTISNVLALVPDYLVFIEPTNPAE
jgi:hypothetical protein